MAQSSTNPKPYKRNVRVSALIQRTLGSHLSTKSLDPRLPHVTITKVDCSPDLRQAKVYISHPDMGNQASQREIITLLRGAIYHLRRHIADQLKLRVVPQLTFCFDASLPDLSRINKLLDQVPTDLAEQE